MAITLGNPAGFVTSGLVLHLDASNSASYPGSGTTWTDLTGSGINATTTGSPTYDSISGSLAFNGSTQFATLANNTNLNSQAISIESWCYLNSTAQDGFIFEKGQVNTQYSMFFNSPSTFYFRTIGISTEDLTFKTTTYVTPNVWTHIVSTYVSGTKSIYVNGILVAQATGLTGTIPTTATGSSVGVYGGQSGARGYYFNGNIKLVRVYNRALSQAEITQNFSVSGITLADGSVQGSGFSTTNDTGQLVSTTTFSENGTWTKPAGCTKVIVTVVGGGGGGAGHCESGGAGGYSEKVIDVTAVSTVAVTVGAGGAAVGYYAAAPNGGTSSFGAYCSATGGYGANRNANHTGGHGGVGSSGDVNFLGGTGTGHSNSGQQQSQGRGAPSYWGGSSGQGHNNNNPSNIYYMAPGTGGTGANQGYNYRAGGPGLVVVYAYK